MGDGSLVVRGFAAKKEDNGVADIDAGIVVHALCRIYNSVTDKHDVPLNLS